MLARTKLRLFLLASFLGAASVTLSYLSLVSITRKGTVLIERTFSSRPDPEALASNALLKYIKSIFTQEPFLTKAEFNSSAAVVRSTHGALITASNIGSTVRGNSNHRRNTFTTATTRGSAVSRPAASVYGDSRRCPKNPWKDTLIELFRAWKEICQKHSIEYVLAFGSLLGAIRNGDVIPWDSDIDILVDKKIFPLLEQLSLERNFDSNDGIVRFVVQPEFRKEVSETRRRFTCEGKETPHMIDQCSFQEPLGRFIKGNLHIDVFHFYHTASGRIKDPSEGTTKTYEKSDFFPFKPCNFLGTTAYCPNKPLKVLRAYFGTDNLDPPYKCKKGRWLSAESRTP